MIENIDFIILDWLQQTLRTPISDKIMSFITQCGNYGLIWIILAIFFLCTKKYRMDGVAVTISLLLCLLVGNLLLKNSICRLRPFQINTDFQIIIPPPSGFSFPSGHTGASFAAAFVLFKTACRKISIPALILALLISFSRLYLYVHFPTDVLAGAILGSICAMLAIRVTSCIFAKKKIIFSKFYKLQKKT